MRRLVSVLAGLMFGASAGWCADAPAAAGVILGSNSYFRTFTVYRTPVILSADGRVETARDMAARDRAPLAEFESARPDAGWTSADFDDTSWSRTRQPIERGSGHWKFNERPGAMFLYQAAITAVMCVRGKFVVTDPAQATDLALSLDYVGGAVVSVNGIEIARQHLPAGNLGADALAERYPDDLYCLTNGAALIDPVKYPEAFEKRYRRIERLAIPQKFLRRGVNVLAVELHRAPVTLACLENFSSPSPTASERRGLWSSVGLRDIRLTAAPGAAVQPSLARPAGMQVWKVLPEESVTAFDFGEPCREEDPIRVVAARNSVFSGRLAVGSAEAIRGLKVTVSDLKRAGGGTLPAAAVLIRYAELNKKGKSWAATRYGSRSSRYDALLEAPPARATPPENVMPPPETYPSNPKGYMGLGYGCLEDGPLIVTRPSLPSAAVVPVWLTIRVPSNAVPGEYAGIVAVTADEQAVVQVPLRLTVCAWTLPDPIEFRVHNLGFTSEDSVALHYGIPYWSDKHFEYLGKTLSLMAEAGSRQVLVNVGLNWYSASGVADSGNRDSMIRWVRNADNSYTHDFSLFEKYLDVVAGSVRQPLPLRLNFWGDVRNDKDNGVIGRKNPDGKFFWYGGSHVVLLDPATGKTQKLEAPPPDSPESVNFWKPAVQGALRRIEARGWTAATVLGHNAYSHQPHAISVSLGKSVWPEGAWGHTAHNGTRNMTWKGAEPGVTMPVRVSECVWTEGAMRSRGWRVLLQPQKEIWCGAARNHHYDTSLLIVLRDLTEHRLLRGEDGVGQLGVDFFPLQAENGRGFYSIDNMRGGLGPACSTLALLAPGPDGPVATERYESFREGVELCEAILYLERNLQEKKIAGELAQRVELFLEERSNAQIWNWASGRFDRDARLLLLAGEVAGSLLDAKP